MRTVTAPTKYPVCVNAQAMHRDHPSTFWAPSKEDLSKIKQGSSVKICVGRERFWVQVTKVKKGGVLVGWVDNNLIFTHEHGLSYEDVVCFSSDNVLNIA